MSFCGDVKNELARVFPEKECCRRAEMAALAASNGMMIKTDSGRIWVRIETDSAAIARKVFKLMKVTGLRSTVKMENRRRFKKHKVYMVNTLLEPEDVHWWQDMQLLEDTLDINRQVGEVLANKNCCRRAYLRGVFLGRGFVNRPEGSYHLEFVFSDSDMADDVRRILARSELEARLLEKKSYLILYIKESEKIVDFLRLVGASNGLLDFENVRIIKSMRNEVNRQVNCETANLAKTIDASVRQIELIKKLVAYRGIEAIPIQLRELAALRVDYPDSSLKELGQMLDPVLSKSGVAYRMRKLESMAKEIMEEDR